jgi:acylphosphatase
MAVKRLSITVTGRVQGVGFRYHTEDLANSLGLSGWVRNNSERTVECEVQGEEEILEEFCKELRKGPPLSRVKDLLVTEIPIANGVISGFEITY